MTFIIKINVLQSLLRNVEHFFLLCERENEDNWVWLISLYNFFFFGCEWKMSVSRIKMKDERQRKIDLL